MSRIISRAESFETVYQAFENINFAAFDYETIKQSMIDYVRLYFPENYNDYIESSEFIPFLELFAYLGETYAYRIDVAAHENFLSTAQRKQNILRLAKLISYNPSRNIPARGLVKIASVITTEAIFDSNGNNLSNLRISWNDANNPNWREQFFLVMNRILEQDFGTVLPKDRVQVDNVLFELYTLKNNTLASGVIPYTVSVSGKTFPMEMVPVELTENGPQERRPENNSRFTFLYGSDGLGDASDTTGFFAFTKQGTLQRISQSYDGITPNQTTNLGVSNINETDVWVNQVDSTTGEIIDDGSVSGYRSGEWIQVDIAHAQNIVFNTNTVRNKYEIETLEDDNVRLIFGDGEFANIPSGTYEIWVRTSANDTVIVPQNTVINRQSSLTYLDSNSLVQTFTFTYSLINTLQNASPSEDIEHIRRIAPAVYYTQDRMVNARDYNTFMLQDPSILKLRAVNRTYAGDSKYLVWNDPREAYQDVKLFGDDLAIYYKPSTTAFEVPSVTGTNLLSDHIEPLLSTIDVFLKLSTLPAYNTRRSFTSTERANILAVLDPTLPNPPLPVNEEVYIFHGEQTPGSGIWWNAVRATVGLPVGFTTTDIVFYAIRDIDNVWTVTYSKVRMIVESPTTKFWNTNSGTQTITFDTLNAIDDQIVILKANTDGDRTGVLSSNIHFPILGQENGDDGLPNIHQLRVVPSDTNGDSTPDNITLSELLNPSVTTTITATLVLPVPFIVGASDITVTGDVDDMTIVWTEVGAVDSISDQVNISDLGTNTTVTVTATEYVYLTRASVLDPWELAPNNETTMINYVADLSGTTHLYARYPGRDQLNFMWSHVAQNFNLVDPSTTNIIDMFVIPRGYYTGMKNWLDGVTTTPPTLPTPYQLRTDYAALLNNKMISDTVVMHPGNFKVLFGDKAPQELRAKFKITKSSNKNLTDNQIKVKVVSTIRQFFSINQWEFGETFYFTELAAAIHNNLSTHISSVVLVPTSSQHFFGDLFQVFVREDEILIPDISVEDIEIVESLNPVVLRQF